MLLTPMAHKKHKQHSFPLNCNAKALKWKRDCHFALKLVFYLMQPKSTTCLHQELQKFQLKWAGKNKRADKNKFTFDALLTLRKRLQHLHAPEQLYQRNFLEVDLGK